MKLLLPDFDKRFMQAQLYFMQNIVFKPRTGMYNIMVNHIAGLKCYTDKGEEP